MRGSWFVNNPKVTWRARLHNILYRSEPGFAELASALLLVLWGVWLLAFPDIFDSGRAYRVLSVLPQSLWAIGAFISGVLQVIAAVVGRYEIRRQAALLAGMFWFLVAASFAAASFASTAVPTYSMIAIFNFWVQYRLGRAIHERSH